VSPASKVLTVGQLLERARQTLLLEHLAETPGSLDRPILSSDVSSPGLALAGYVERFPGRRLQVMGETEITYLARLSDDERLRILRLFFSFPLPCLFVTKSLALPAGLAESAREAGVPILRSALKTNEFYRRIKPVLEEAFAPTTTLHGSLADVFGVGLLFQGKSGIGKSECVLDLVERGHRLVADDLVFVTRRGNDVLIGRGHEQQRHFMEVRGIGLIDIPAIFGIRAVRQQKRIEVVVQLLEWNREASADRTGLDAEMTTVLDVELPKITVYLNPGKNITVIAEVIAMNHLLRYSGTDPATAFNERLIARMRRAADDRVTPPAIIGRAEVRQYLQEDDE
jgi:HPr kinase/phosphorylase